MRNWMILAVVLMICMGSYSVRADQYKATALYPANEAGGVGAAAVLQWEAPELIVDPEYTVYFDTDPNFESGPVAGMPQTATEYDPFGDEDMDVLTKYFWRVDVYDPNVGGIATTHTGDRWSFNVALLPGLVMYYDFEDDPNDSSGNGYHGSLQGDALFVDDVTRGKVLSLDGTDDFMNLVETKTAADLGLDGNKPKSMTAWVYPRSFNNGGIFDVGSHSGGQEFCLRTLANPHQWRIQYHGGEYDVDYFCLSLNVWVHFALVYDGTDTRMYVNGILIAEAPRALDTSGSDPFRVGQYGGDEFDGLIDDFAIWDRALSQEEVRRLMPAGDLNASGGVNAADLKTFTDDWLTSTTTPVYDPVTLEDFEIYSSGDFPRMDTWFHYPDADDCPESSGTPSLLEGDPGAPAGSKALRIVYDYPAACTDNDEWLLVGHFLPAHVDLAQYDELSFWVRTHAANSPSIGWVLSFASDFGTPGVPHLTTTVGPFSSTQTADEWLKIEVDLRDVGLVDWDVYGSIDNVQYINAIVITAINVVGGVPGQLTLDIDDIKLLDYAPGCSARSIGDVNDDCIVDKADFAILADEWMKMSMGL